jgi:glycosyltransferase involved in cell wall biosynthesis
MTRTVLYFSPSVSMYGARVALLQLVTALDPQRYRPAVICLREGDLTDALRARSVATHVVGIHPWRKAKTWPLIPFNTARLGRILRHEQADILHCNDFWAMPWARAARWWARSDAPIVCHVRNPVGQRRVRKYGLVNAECVLTISNALREEFAHWPRPVREARLQTIYDGMDFDALDAQEPDRDIRAELGIEPERSVILQVGHISRRKDQAALLRAVLHFPDERRPHVVFVGGVKPHDEDFAAEVRRMSSQPALAGRVHFAGFQENVGPYYRACDVLALPSREEGLGLVAVEAMHFGKPVVGSRTGGIPEVVEENKTGYLVTAGNADELAGRLSSLLSDSGLCRRFGAAGQARAHERFALDAHASAVQDLYNSIHPTA